jgi:hypothetical protein
LEIKKVSKREFKEIYGEDTTRVAAFTHREKGREPIVYLRGGGNNSNSLRHEIYHAKYSPELEDIEEGKKFRDWDDCILEELRAEAFSYEKKGRGIPLNSIGSIAQSLIEAGFAPSETLNTINRGLKSVGYSLSDDNKSILWWWIKGYYKKFKESD